MPHVQAEAVHVDLITVYDCTGASLGHFPVPGGVKMAGYVTGEGVVPWTPTQFAMHPDAIRIDQSPVNTPADETADVLDVEQFAATLAQIPEWVHAAWTSFRTVKRPGQREPAVYSSRSTVTPIVNTLLANGITNGVGLFIAAPDTSQNAIAEVTAASGPFPVIGRQYGFQPDHDISVVSANWFNNVSGKPAAPSPGPGTQTGWKYCHKCTCLVFPNSNALPVCSAGGPHDTSQSHTYTLSFTV